LYNDNDTIEFCVTHHLAIGSDLFWGQKAIKYVSSCSSLYIISISKNDGVLKGNGYFDERDTLIDINNRKFR